MEKRTLQRTILRYRHGRAAASEDAILVEFPLEIVINDVPYAALMCTPGHDVELALGFCLTERLLMPDEECLVLSQVSFEHKSVLHLEIAGGAGRVHRALAGRKPMVGVSCCGNRSATCCADLTKGHFAYENVGCDFALHPQSLLDVQKEAEACQELFSVTGATHFSALYDHEQSLVAYAEDVGRHNALDKAAGQAFRTGEGTSVRLVVLSSRVSYEMVQKAVSLKAQVVAGFSAVTTGAVELAQEAGITLVGFLRNPRFNVYTHPERLGLNTSVFPDVASEPVPVAFTQ